MKTMNINIYLEEIPLIIKEKKAVQIVDMIDAYFNVKTRSLGRYVKELIPRQMAMYYIRKYLKLPYSKIGTFFPSNDGIKNHKDHATVVHAYTTISNYLEFDVEIKMYDSVLSANCEKIIFLNKEQTENYRLIKFISDNIYNLSAENLTKIQTLINEINE